MELGETVKEKAIYYRWLDLYIYHLHALTSHKSVMKNWQLWWLERRRLSVFISSSGWLDDNGEKYRFNIKDKTLYMGNLAIDFKQEEL